MCIAPENFRIGKRKWDFICEMRIFPAKSSMRVVEKFISKIKSPSHQIVAEIILRKVSRAVIERQCQWAGRKGLSH
jgi:hypothetical protein